MKLISSRWFVFQLLTRYDGGIFCVVSQQLITVFSATIIGTFVYFFRPKLSQLTVFVIYCFYGRFNFFMHVYKRRHVSAVVSMKTSRQKLDLAVVVLARLLLTV